MGMNKRYLSPAEVWESFLTTGERKAALPMGNMLVAAILAGAFIALAGVGSTWASMEVDNLSLRRLIAGCVFPAGLAMVVLTGTELFTGNCLMTIALLERRITAPAMLRNWCVVYAGNLIGAAAVAAMAVWGGVFAGKESFLIAAAVGKVLPVEQAVFRGILCNLLVCMGVLMAAAATDAGGKIAALFFPVAIFVMAGYEHSVANMYYLAAGVLAGADLSAADVLLGNLLPVTVGNIIGGAVLLGGGYWYIYRKGNKQNG
jgi:formate/nitrite transporter